MAGIKLNKAAVKMRLQEKADSIQTDLAELQALNKDIDKRLEKEQARQDAEYVASVKAAFKVASKLTDAKEISKLLGDIQGNYREKATVNDVLKVVGLDSKYKMNWSVSLGSEILRLQQKIKVIHEAMDELDLFASDEVPANGHLSYLNLIR